jgi:hypothetical protein
VVVLVVAAVVAVVEVVVVVFVVVFMIMMMVIVVVVFVVIEFLTSQLQLGNIHLSWDMQSTGIGLVVLFVI